MKRLIYLGALAVVLLITTSIARARLGETFEECKARYGEPVEIFKTDGRFSPVFRKADFIIHIEFYEGKAALLLYRKPNGFLDAPFTDTEIATFMRANAGESAWIKGEDSENGMRTWVTKGALLFSFYDATKHYLTLATKEGMKRYLDTLEKGERQRLKGF